MVHGVQANGGPSAGSNNVLPFILPGTIQFQNKVAERHPIPIAGARNKLIWVLEMRGKNTVEANRVGKWSSKLFSII